MRELFKLQWPIAGGRNILVQNQSSSVFVEMRIDNDLRRLFKNGQRLKVYVFAEMKNDQLHYEIDLQPESNW